MIPLLLLKVVVKRSRFRKNQEKREEEERDPATLAPHTEEQKSSTRSGFSPLSLRFFFKSFSARTRVRARTKNIHHTK